MMFSKRPKYRKKLSNRFALFIVSFFCAVVLFLYILNARLMPTYVQYAEVQTTKIASHVVSKAINSRTSSVLDINEIIEDLPSESDYMLTTKFNTEIINQIRSETVTLVKEHLELAEQGDLSQYPDLENVEYDVNEIQKGDGIVFYVPIAQALNLPLLGNLGPRVPIRFHIIGSVSSSVNSSFKEFGINNALVEVNVDLEVKVQIIIPFASQQATIKQTIPVAIGLVRGQVPHIYTQGGEGAQPSVEVPIPFD
ncbi:sporulation protein YunB [Lysinibacillus yapensis]|uniref:Sporulation protein YunB n=2 Tax=Ureibacillus yapensis TaxID=2304605 RepID=A0A396SF43_9BACL|nr:sporulation protein YunB [Lysinibacillus yapensis]